MSGVALKLIVGLGNPGEEYARTRHNAGFRLLDELARRHGGSFRLEARHQGELARIRIGALELWLLKPQSFMNNSGAPTASVAGFYRISPEEILVAYDELDFPPGVARLKQGGGHAGHNGMRSILAHVGEAVWRLRIGVGRADGRREGVNYVLGRAPAAEEQLIHDSIAAAADAIPVMLEQGAQKAMHQLHACDAAAPSGPAP
ncbi:MAG TPA: aminoacyl-tRNA hydrolase [Steroidobacteraceae bacterium]|nr:aminoacyl-tRNA hydrolase [Steroidobacteraceae bacterium]